MKTIQKNCVYIFLFSLLFSAAASPPKIKKIENSDNQIQRNTREDLIIYYEDFEGDVSGWGVSAGWQLTEDSYNSATHSFRSPDELWIDENGNPSSANWDLFSPIYELPLLGDGESMHFSFYLNNDMPDWDGDGDDYIEDYYAIFIMDLDSLAWHVSDFNSTDGNNYWCGKEDVGGYLNKWVQYLDTPSFTVSYGATLSADMTWGLESPAGATVAGTCTDGWDQANVQISVDGGNTFTIIEGSVPYDFDCGYGMVFNGFECTGNGDCAGWGGNSGGWNNVSFDLSSYAGEDAIIRFGFYSDPGYSTLDDISLTGFQVDNIQVEGGDFEYFDYYDDADESSEMIPSGAVWVEQFYDYGEEIRPGANGWEEYLPGYAYNGNVFLDISDFQGKDVIFRFQSRYDENQDGGAGEGLYIDDFKIYKISPDSYLPPSGLTVEAGDYEAVLSWDDMNFEGVVDYQYDNDILNENGGISLSSEDAIAWAGATINTPGESNVQSVSVFNINEPGVVVDIAAFGTFGTAINTTPTHLETVTLYDYGWNSFDVDWDINGLFVIGHSFTHSNAAVLDQTVVPSNYSMVLLGDSWDLWSDVASSNGSIDGEWGIRATVEQESANVTYNIYRDENLLAWGLDENGFSDQEINYNQTYTYQVSANYPDGGESFLSTPVEFTPQSETAHELIFDDGSAESGFEIGSANYLLVNFNANELGEDLLRFKWYQLTDGGAFYIKIFEDANGEPGAEIYSKVIAGGLITGWNERNLADDQMVLSGSFWVGFKAFASTSEIGIDHFSEFQSSNSVFGSPDNWETFEEGNPMIRLILDNIYGNQELPTGDSNDDGTVDIFDVILIISQIIDGEYYQVSDLNSDGNMDILDIIAVVNIILDS